MDFLPALAFDPLVPLPFVLVLTIIALLAALAAGLGRLHSMFLRTFATIIIAIALLNPQTVEEDREPLRDIVLVLSDRSESTQLGTRDAQVSAAIENISASISTDNTLEVVTATIPADNDGTRLSATLIEALADIPQTRLAGVILVSDGQVHDLPENPETLLPENIPFHSLIIGDPQRRDRRISSTLAPRYGLVGEQAEYRVKVDDPGFEGERAQIAIKLNGELIARFGAIIGDQVSIPVKIEKRGVNTVELIVESAPDELTLKNNVFVSEISGIRDKLRVLLITGEPHRGGRAWRDLLKSDAGVDMVHFTILTNPQVKNPRARSVELSLIAFPVRQLFEDKLEEFDMIIFDQFTRRSQAPNGRRLRPILPPIYFQNIAEYVERGGALMIATGPAFATENSIYRSPLAAVLPARPTGETFEDSFRPKLNANGKRHPITSDFNGTPSDTWGPWYRIIENNPVSGDVIMEGPGGEALLVIDRIGEGRVGMVMSDQAWLWSKGYQGGGPHGAKTRWHTRNYKALTIRKWSFHGLCYHSRPRRLSPKLRRGQHNHGHWHVKPQRIFRSHALHKATYPALRKHKPLTPLSENTGGFLALIGDGTRTPSIRRIKTNAERSGDDWLGLVKHERYTIQASRRTPLAQSWLYVLLAALALAWAWRREGA